MKLNVLKIDDDHRVVAGKVTKVRPGTGSSAGKVVNVTIEGTAWNGSEEVKETLDIAFWNNDSFPMADRIEQAGVSEGDVIAAEVYEKDGKATGNKFMRRGHWTYPENENRKERNVFMGTVVMGRTGESASGSAYTKVSVPVTSLADKNDTEWYGITFWNQENSKLADNAAKVLAENENGKKKAVIVTGPVSEDLYEGKTYLNASGYSFEVLPSQPRNSRTTA